MTLDIDVVRPSKIIIDTYTLAGKLKYAKMEKEGISPIDILKQMQIGVDYTRTIKPYLPQAETPKPTEVYGHAHGIKYKKQQPMRLRWFTNTQ